MSPLAGLIRHFYQRVFMLFALLCDAARFLRLCLRPSATLAAENLFLRTQLALYQDREVKPRRATNATRLVLVWLSQWFDWPPALTLVHPETFKRWQRQGFGLLWRSRSCPGRPPISVELQGLIHQMGCDNLTWGQRRIANELRLKLGLQVSPRTVRKYMPQHLDHAPGHHVPSQRWRTFVRNHAQALISSGVTGDLTQGSQAFAARLIRGLQGWWDGADKSRMQELPQKDAVRMGLRHEAVLAPITWSVRPLEVMSEDGRSPPDMRPPYYPNPFPAAQATPVNTLDVCPAVGVGCSWNRARTRSQRAEPLRTSASQAVLITASGMTTRAEGVSGGDREPKKAA
jgi:hypothetical protein